MEQNRGRFNYFMFFILLLGVAAIVAAFSKIDDNYTRQQFIRDVEQDKVQEVEMHPNAEVPTGYLKVTFKSGAERKLFVSDIVEAEALVRSYGFDPTVKMFPGKAGF